MQEEDFSARSRRAPSLGRDSGASLAGQQPAAGSGRTRRRSIARRISAQARQTDAGRTRGSDFGLEEEGLDEREDGFDGDLLCELDDDHLEGESSTASPRITAGARVTFDRANCSRVSFNRQSFHDRANISRVSFKRVSNQRLRNDSVGTEHSDDHVEGRLSAQLPTPKSAQCMADSILEMEAGSTGPASGAGRGGAAETSTMRMRDLHAADAGKRPAKSASSWKSCPPRLPPSGEDMEGPPAVWRKAASSLEGEEQMRPVVSGSMALYRSLNEYGRLPDANDDVAVLGESPWPEGPRSSSPCVERKSFTGRGQISMVSTFVGTEWGSEKPSDARSPSPIAGRMGTLDGGMEASLSPTASPKGPLIVNPSNAWPMTPSEKQCVHDIRCGSEEDRAPPSIVCPQFFSDRVAPQPVAAPQVSSAAPPKGRPTGRPQATVAPAPEPPPRPPPGRSTGRPQVGRKASNSLAVAGPPPRQ